MGCCRSDGACRGGDTLKFLRGREEPLISPGFYADRLGHGGCVLDLEFGNLTQMEKIMKRILLACALAVAFTFSLGAGSAEAGGIRFGFRTGSSGQGYGNHGYYDSGYGGLYGGNSFGRAYRGSYGWNRTHSDWHDTSHYDYQPGYSVRHYDHYDYTPGHYDRHNTGHLHRH